MSQSGKSAVLHSGRHDHYRSSGGFSVAWASLTHQQELADPGGAGTGDTSRAGVRRLVNRHLFLPHPHLGRGYRSGSSGSDLLDQSDDV